MGKMRWQDKINMVVKDVLGIEYTAIITSNNSFSIYENNDSIADHSCIYELESHWREQVTKVLETIHKQRIQKALSKV